MSGLDTSQELTVDASKHAAEHHEHSVEPASDAEKSTTSDDESNAAAARKD